MAESKSGSSKTCHACATPFGWLRSGMVCPKQHGGCGHSFCNKCCDYACITEKMAHSSPTSTSSKPLPVLFCKSCFMKISSLDFEKDVDVIEPTSDDSKSPGHPRANLVWLHGAGGCRVMFHWHAQQLSQHGYRSILLDLPAHGAHLDEELTLDGAIRSVVDTVHQYIRAEDKLAIPTIIIGASLGGYISMELLGKYSQLFDGAVVAMCGQNTGVGRSLKASVGLSCMGALVPSMSARTVLNGLLDQARKNGHIEAAVLNEIALRPGMFFHGAAAHIAILRASNPRASLPKFQSPILYINGTQDHRDSEAVWLSCSVKGTLIDYDGGDHFFSHDTRFMTRLVDDIHTFIQAVLATPRHH